MTVKITTLPNGLRVVTDTMPAVETVSVGVWVGAGTRHEPAPVNGVSHFLEHMAFKGTERRGPADIAAEIEAVGGHLNAYTSRENTAFYAKVLKDDTPLAVDILSDILLHSTFPVDELERERTVILQEIGQALDQPEDVAFDAFQVAAYPGQAVGRPVLGDEETVGGMSRADVVAYMRERYKANDMVVAAAGAVEHDAIVELAARQLANLPTGAGPVAEVARYTGGEARLDRDSEQVHLVLGFPGVSYCADDYYASLVLSTLYGGGMSSRLFQEVREKRGLVYSIYSFASGLQDGGLFGVYAGTGPEEANEVMSVICDELRAVAADSSDEEVRRARAQLRASILMARESTSARCEQAAHQMLVYGRPLETEELVARIEAVDAAAVSRLAADLAASVPTVAAVGPVSRLMPFDAMRERLAA